MGEPSLWLVELLLTDLKLERVLLLAGAWEHLPMGVQARGQFIWFGTGDLLLGGEGVLLLFSVGLGDLVLGT